MKFKYIKSKKSSSENIVFVTDQNAKSMFSKFYNGSYFTCEGADSKDGFKDWFKGINDLLMKEGIGQFKILYVFNGKQMNTIYKLTGDNAYPNDLDFIAFPLDGLDISKLAMFKIRFEGRWFDDIVDNNARRQQENQEDEFEEDYDEFEDDEYEDE